MSLLKLEENNIGEIIHDGNKYYTDWYFITSDIIRVRMPNGLVLGSDYLKLEKQPTGVFLLRSLNCGRGEPTYFIQKKP